VGGTLSSQAVSCGLPFLLVPLKTVDALSRARVRLELWERTLARFWSPHILIAARDTEQGEHCWRTRVFVPALNVPEDPATGSATAAFGGWLAMKNPRASGDFAWKVEQGVEMGRPSRLEVKATKYAGAVTAVRVAGEAVLVGEGVLRSEASAWIPHMRAELSPIPELTRGQEAAFRASLRALAARRHAAPACSLPLQATSCYQRHLLQAVATIRIYAPNE
jgi:hypothetical protein